MTTLLAVFSVGAFTFGALTITVEQQGSTAGDSRAMRLADKLHSGLLVDIAKVVTDFGALPVTGGAIVLTALLLIRRRRIPEAVTLVTAMALTVAAVNVVKAATDRPRPSASLVHTAGQSFPSGHAAYAVAWVAIAVVLGRALPGIARSASLVVASIVLCVVIGATRVYLRAHYLSDVLGGVGLAAAIFALCGMVAIVVVHVRNNARAPS
jgi:undecaprenyl-diphosphatase